MKTTLRIRNILFLAGVATLSTGVTACLITTGGSDDLEDCSPVGANSHRNASGDCVCDVGFDPCTTQPSDGSLACCDDDSSSAGEACASGTNNVLQVNPDTKMLACYCIEGFDWCDPSDTSNLNCCNGTETGTGTDSGSNTETGTGTDTETTDPMIPDSCNADEEGGSICTNTNEMLASSGRLFVCESGKFVEKFADYMDQACKDLFQGDFAAGCWDDGAAIQYDCQVGPGTQCNVADANTCSDDKAKLYYCYQGRLAATQCTPTDGDTCKVVGPDGSTVEFETGECGEQEDEVSCLCFDPDTDTDTTTDETTTDETTSEETTSTRIKSATPSQLFRRKR